MGPTYMYNYEKYFYSYMTWVKHLFCVDIWGFILYILYLYSLKPGYAKCIIFGFWLRGQHFRKRLTKQSRCQCPVNQSLLLSPLRL